MPSVSRPRLVGQSDPLGGLSLLVAAAILLLATAPAVAFDPVFNGTSLVAFEAFGNRLEHARKSKSPDQAKTLSVSSAQESRAWGMNYGFSSRTGADSRGPALKSGGAGFVAGVDRLLDPTLLAGVAFAFSRAETSSAGVHKDFDTFSGGPYLSWAPFDGWELDGFLGNTWVEMDSRRLLSLKGTLVPTGGRSRGPGLSAAASAGYRFRSPTSFGEAYVKPLVSLGYENQKQRGYLESGPFGPGLAFPAERVERSTLNLGLAAGAEVSAGADFKLRPELRLAWSRYLSDPSPKVPAFLFGAPASISDPEPGRDGALVSLEVAGWKRRDLQAFAGYSGEFRPNSTVHQGHGGVRLTW